MKKSTSYKYREDTLTPVMTSWSEPVVLFLLLVTQSIVSGTNNNLTIDTNVVANKTDSDVVDEVVNIITRNCIFPDQFFLQRLAIVESTQVKDIKTQKSIKYHGGIWKVDRNKFQQTKSLQLKPVHEQIRKKLNINWDQVRWSDLRKPLYSGLAAALYILLNTGESGIPSGISEQAHLWKTIYRTAVPSSVFLEKVNKLKLGSTLLDKHNQTFLCGKHTRNNSNIKVDSKNNSVNIGNAIAKSVQKPTKTPRIDDQNQLHKTEDILKILCTQNAVKEQRKFQHPSERNKYIMCKAVSIYSIRNCQDGKYFNVFQQACTQSNCDIPIWVNQKETATIDKSYPSPCKIDAERVCNLIFVSHLHDPTKFIQCDKMGNAILKTCPIDWIWSNQRKACFYRDKNQTMQICSVPIWDNPNEVGTALPEFYPNPCKVDGTRNCDYIYLANLMDMHKFIRCDKLGQALVKSCPTSSNWNTAENECIGNGIIRTPAPVITTPKPQCPIPVWDNPNEVGTALPEFYPNPCKVDSTRICEYIYLNNILDINKFIRCDKLGQALVKSCPTSSNWNSALNKCIGNGVITTPAITTPKPQCPIPVWDNPNEVGTALPEFYPNPCKVDSTRICEYIYLNNILDINKFIRCDKLGQALVKSCPTSSNWNSALNKCIGNGVITTPAPVITTPKPQCPIPVWDNPNEVGTPLPEFYKNPCKADGTRNCDYIYVTDLMDTHKFIRCDRLGQAIIKTCPTSSNWNTAQNKCIGTEVITTPKPQCPIPIWDDPNEAGTPLPKFYVNPCKADGTRNCDYIYVTDLMDAHKFIRCDRLGQAIIKTCPTSSNWNSALNKCIGIEVITTPAPVITTPKPQCPIPVWDNPNEVGTALPEFYPNPCKVDSTRICEYIYLNNMLDINKFIRCDKLGQALVKSCPTSSNWNSALNKCIGNGVITTPAITTPKPQCPIPVWDNPNEVGTPLPEFYPNPCKVDSTRICEYIYLNNILDINKFIRCDKLGQALVKSCPTSSNWNSALNKCMSTGVITTPAPVITTPKPQCPIPVWDNPNEVGTALPEFYPNPCKVDSTRICEYIYLNNMLDINKFIRCDKLGQALVKSCPTSSNWNSALNKCIGNGVITTPAITTPKPQCPIPVWDNPNEVGTPLPEFYPNPCKVDSTRICEYIYLNNILDINKFIRCDKLGQALVKSCPTSSNWNSALNKCMSTGVITTPAPVITTPKPQCPIPVWDNPNEVGTALPEFYPNPCKVDSTRICEYIYLNNMLDINKFIRCDKLGQALVKSCPTSSNWNSALNKCIGNGVITTPAPVITTPKPQCPIPVWDNPNEVGTALPEFYPNPCKVDSTRICEYIYLNNMLDINKFIRCDKLGQALVKSCPTSSNWNSALNKCMSTGVITTPAPVITTPKPQCPIPVWDNPNEVGTALPEFYPNPCKVDSTRICEYIYLNNMLDINKFIRCDKLGQALVKSCPTSSNWNSALNKCIGNGVITTPAPVITTPKPQCPIPVWDNPNEVGTALPDFYPNPCEADSGRTCNYIYLDHILDDNKFIKCDKLGKAIVKSCPTSSNWNIALNKCLSIVVIKTPAPVIPTPKPECPIPVWDNPNEAGTSLPHYLPNPCKIDQMRSCQFIYLGYPLNDHKFIQCNRIGKALIKSCPSSQVWDSVKKQC